MNSRRGKIVVMVIMIVIVLLSSGGEYLRVGMCCWGLGGGGGDKDSLEWISCSFLLMIFELFVFTSMSLMR